MADKFDRVDRLDLESDRRLYRTHRRLHELLRDADGSAPRGVKWEN
jgi:hypothetical protein